MVKWLYVKARINETTSPVLDHVRMVTVANFATPKLAVSQVPVEVSVVGLICPTLRPVKPPHHRGMLVLPAPRLQKHEQVQVLEPGRVGGWK